MPPYRSANADHAAAALHQQTLEALFAALEMIMLVISRSKSAAFELALKWTQNGSWRVKAERLRLNLEECKRELDEVIHALRFRHSLEDTYARPCMRDVSVNFGQSYTHLNHAALVIAGARYDVSRFERFEVMVEEEYSRRRQAARRIRKRWSQLKWKILATMYMFGSDSDVDRRDFAGPSLEDLHSLQDNVSRIEVQWAWVEPDLPDNHVLRRMLGQARDALDHMIQVVIRDRERARVAWASALGGTLGPGPPRGPRRTTRPRG